MDGRYSGGNCFTRTSDYALRLIEPTGWIKEDDQPATAAVEAPKAE